MGGIETMEQHKLLTDGNRNAAISLEDIIKEFTPKDTVSNTSQDLQNLMILMNYWDYPESLKILK